MATRVRLTVQEMISALDAGLLPRDEYDHRSVQEVYDAGLISDSDVQNIYSAHAPEPHILPALSSDENNALFTALGRAVHRSLRLADYLLDHGISYPQDLRDMVAEFGQLRDELNALYEP